MISIVYKNLQICCIFLCIPQTLWAQDSYRAEFLQIWKGHKRVEVYSRGTSVQLAFNNGTMKTVTLDTLFEQGFFSHGTYIRYSDVRVFYSERTSFFYKAVLRPLGPAMMGFSAYVGLNAAGLLIIRGPDDPNTRIAAKYTVVSLAGGYVIYKFSEAISYKKHRTSRCRITVM